MCRLKKSSHLSQKQKKNKSEKHKKTSGLGTWRFFLKKLEKYQLKRLSFRVICVTIEKQKRFSLKRGEILRRHSEKTLDNLSSLSAVMERRQWLFALTPEEWQSNLTELQVESLYQNIHNLDDWRKYRNINKYLTERTFDKLDSKDVTSLLKTLYDSEWYQIHQQVMEIVLKNKILKYRTLQDFLTPHIQWLEQELNQVIPNLSYHVEPQVLSQFCRIFVESVEDLIQTVLKQDSQEFFEFQMPELEPELFRKLYLQKRFYTTQDYIQFFAEYPVLARLLAEKVQHFYKKCRAFLEGLQRLSLEEKNYFDLPKELNLEQVQIDPDSSDEHGNFTLFTVINQQKLIFRAHYLEIGTRFNDFLNEISVLYPDFQTYQVKRLAKKEFMLEEFVETKACQTEEEAAAFYRRFGYMLTLMYVLCGNDFRLENLVMVRDLPALINIDELIQNYYSVTDSAMDEYVHFEDRQQIIGAKLLPQIYKHEKDARQLNGYQEDKHSSRVILLNMLNRDHETVVSSSIPKGESEQRSKNIKSSLIQYSDEIYQGFTNMYTFLLENRESIYRLVVKYFSNMLIRNNLRSRKLYASLLEQSCQLPYMRNMLDRVQLFQQLTKDTIEHEELVEHEVADLLLYTIPVFYSYTNSQLLVTATGKIITDFYPSNSLERVRKRLVNLNKKDFHLQANRLKLALNLYHGEATTISFKNESETLAGLVSEMIELISDQAILTHHNQDLVFPAYVLDEDERWKKQCMSEDLLRGNGGIQYLLNQAQSYLPLTETSIQIRTILNQKLSYQKLSINTEAQLSIALTRFYLLAKNLETKYTIRETLLLKELLHKMHNYIRKCKHFGKWQNKDNLLLKICLKAYSVTQLEEIKEFIFELLYDTTMEEKATIGFYTGYAGLVYNLQQADILFPDNQEIQTKLAYFAQKLFEVDLEKVTDYSWETGILGMFYGLRALYYVDFIDITKAEIREKIEQLMQLLLAYPTKDDALCSGKSAIWNVLLDVQNDAALFYNFDRTTQQAILQKLGEIDITYEVRGMPEEPDLSLFDGLAGIAYTVLRFKERSLPNPLLFD